MVAAVAEQSASSATDELRERLLAEIEGWREDPATVARFLSWNSRFTSYSVLNRMFILAQLPTATRVAGFGAWRDLGRTVKKGSRALAVLAPLPVTYETGRTLEDGSAETRSYVRAYRRINVFDISATAPLAGEPDRYADLVGEVVATPTATAEEFSAFVAALPHRIGLRLGLGLASAGGPTVRFTLAPDGTVNLGPQLRGVDRDLALLEAIVAHAVTHRGARTNLIAAADPGAGTVGGLSSTVRADDFRTRATAWLIADRFGVDASTRVRASLGAYRAAPGGEQSDFRRELTAVAASARFFDLIEGGTPVAWALAYLDASAAEEEARRAG